MNTLLQDLRFSLRMLAKNPGFTVVAVLTLGLGIGANTAIFTVVNAVLLRQLTLPRPGQLVTLWETFRQGISSVSVPDFKDWREQNDIFQGLAAYQTGDFNLKGAESPERVPGTYVSANFFDLMGQPALQGRGFLSGEDVLGRNRVVVLGEALWKGKFGGRQGAVGGTISLNSESYTVVGVMPASFRFPTPTAQLWVPFVPSTAQQAARGNHFLQVVGRLKPSATLSQAHAQMAGIMRRIALQHPRETGSRDVLVRPLKTEIVGDVERSLHILLVAVAFVFLIACANIVNLLLARGSERQKEIALRRAVGADRWRLLRQFLTEGIALAALGGSLGWVLAVWGVDLIVFVKPANLPRLAEIRPDAYVLGYTFALVLFTAVALAAAMALQGADIDVWANIKELAGASGSRHRRGREAIVVGEVASALVLVISAGLLIESFFQLLRVEPGFERDHLLTMRIALPAAKYHKDHTESAFYQPMLEKVDELPGVKSAGVITLLPVEGGGLNNTFEVEGRPKPDPSQYPLAEIRAVSPHYFHALSIPIIRGRDFTDHDNQDATAVLIINKVLADQFFPGEDPIGKRLRGFNNQWWPIVGVVGNTRQANLAKRASPEIDFCYLQAYALAPQLVPFMVRTMRLVVRTAGDPNGFVDSIRRAILSVDPDQPVFEVRTMEEVISGSVADRRFDTLLLGAFAGLSLILAMVGVYGIVSYSVRQRTREISIRMALGARRADVLKMVLRQGMKPAITGVAIGIPVALGLTGYLSSLLYGVRPTDPVTFIAVALILIGVALCACYFPARRATKVDPMVALRYE